MRVRLLDAAETEAQEAARWYEQQRQGLGLAFLDALTVALEAIEQHPQRFEERFGAEVVHPGRTACGPQQAVLVEVPT